MNLTIDQNLVLSEALNATRNGGQVDLSDQAKLRIEKCRKFLDQFSTSAEKPIYGINTGFGALHDVVIEPENLRVLQENLVRSHACGMGEEISIEIARLMILLKIQGLALGHSGVQLATVDLLVELFNRNITPIIFAKGSLGASGDLAPLAHMSLTLLGDGQVWYKGQKVDSKTALDQEGLQPIELQSKEGLALLNGTQFMSSHGAYLSEEAARMYRWSNLIGALSLDALEGHITPFDADIHRVRPHKGQQETAASFRSILEDSQLITQPKQHVQDPYCLRCIPQVHGAAYDAIEHIRKTVLIEINSVTDNPTIFPDENKIISAGNFHGEPMAISLDLMAIALAELGSISERRTYKLNAGLRGLPSFLVKEPGLNSGFMIAQYTAASIVSENKQLATPASVDTIDSSQGQEDHVSMGANAATKGKRVLDNLKQILAIELFNAAQAMDFKGAENTSSSLQGLVKAFRIEVPFIERDVIMHDHMVKALNFIEKHEPSAF